VTHETARLRRRSLYGYWGLVAAQILSYFPFAYLLLLNLFRGLDASLEEAAAPWARTGQGADTVSLPLLVPASPAPCVLLFGYSFADLGNPLLLGGDFPCCRRRSTSRSSGSTTFPEARRSPILLLLPAVLPFFSRSTSRRARRTRRLGARLGAPPQSASIRRKAARSSCCGVTSLVILMQYLTVLAVRRRASSASTTPSRAAHFRGGLTSSRDALVDTIAGRGGRDRRRRARLLIAYFVARTRAFGRGRSILRRQPAAGDPRHRDRLGFALAFKPPAAALTGTAFIIVVAFSMRALPYTIRSGVARVQQLHPSLDEASTNLGATREQTLWRVLLPLGAPAVVAG
jgi:iron(III) transport system permease protein